MNDILELIDEWARQTHTCVIAEFNFQTTYFNFKFTRVVKLSDGYMHGYEVRQTIPKSYLDNMNASADLAIALMLKEVDEKFKKVEVEDNGAE